MPDINGFEVLEYMKKKKMNVPVVVISADVQETTRDRVIALGATAVVNKPPKGSDLINAIVKIIK